MCTVSKPARHTKQCKKDTNTGPLNRKDYPEENLPCKTEEEINE
jgi:hypothetical protein